MTLPRYTKNDLLIMVVVLIPWTFFLNVLMLQGHYFDSWAGFAAASVFTFFMHALAWQIHTWIAVTLRERFPSEQHNTLRLWFSVFLYMLVTCLTITLTYWLYDMVDFLGGEFYTGNYRVAIIAGLVVNTFATFLHEGAERFEKWKVAITENEQLKKEYMQSQLLGLKSQINPHFLFNSLNTLSSLINEDEKEAEDFLNQMSKVYRYLLRNNEEELVTLQTELQFIESYFYLLKMRHGRALQLQVAVDANDMHKLLPPLTLQMLMENTLNNNVVTKNEPIVTQIVSTAGDWLEVRNNIHRKSDECGLTENIDNITKKFRLLCQKEVAIIECNDERRIRIPLINETKMHVA
ncbi:MAG: sensor histidine kinase [Chitinophagaceae bacterium]